MSNETKEIPSGCINAMLCLRPLLIVLWAAALTLMWNWFVVPLTAWPAFTVPVAVGLLCVRGLVYAGASGYNPTWTESQRKDAAMMEFGLQNIHLAVCFAVGYVAHLFTLLPR